MREVDSRLSSLAISKPEFSSVCQGADRRSCVGVAPDCFASRLPLGKLSVVLPPIDAIGPKFSRPTWFGMQVGNAQNSD